MLSRLDHETRDHHAAAYADLFAVLDEPTVVGYRRFLTSIYHFEYAIEARLVYVTELPIRFIATRLRSGLLADDLVALGTDPGSLAIFARPLSHPDLPGAPEALGWIYAIQRNTLGHAALYRALATRLREPLRRASRYLTAYANTVHQRWHELGILLDQFVGRPELADRIVAAAGEALTRQHQWYGSHGEDSLLSVQRARAMR